MSNLPMTSRGAAIMERLDPDVLKMTRMMAGTGMVISTMSEAMEISKIMALSGPAVPKAFRDQPALCFSVVNLAVKWEMDPWAVIKKAYVVNDVVAFEAQLVHALVLTRAPIRGRVLNEFMNPVGPKRVCRVWAHLAEHVANPNGEIPDYTSPEFGVIKPKNSPLWINDPDQQLFYFSVRAFSRRHFPDVLLGVYSDDEIDRDRPPVDAVRAQPPRTLEVFTAPRQAMPAAEAVTPAAQPAAKAEPEPTATNDDGDRADQFEAAYERGRELATEPRDEPQGEAAAAASDAGGYWGPVMPAEILAQFEGPKSKWIPAWNWLRSAINAQGDPERAADIAIHYKAVLARVARDDRNKVDVLLGGHGLAVDNILGEL